MKKDNFSDNMEIIIQSASFHDNSSINSNSTLTFNPVDKWLETLEDNKKLYKALLESEREKVVMLEKLLSERK